ncbi:hypothetical protein HBI18_219550 [Parastagonospora nodorum]|nr:hypothetical protein HBH52_074370 [Parastagonospora nodorum]KAH4082905.1 hypothetical protein HBH46_219710 [Parastagonospora nodorum]KAH5483899.1 hypothetical protein HBI31_173960 [Parastagonospora nodorum]KAH5711439.1 hypothetical protein HBI18_219550 [Parastagonospora nodorum]KAH5728835.1 hypothetical protein HBI17_225740 [Parastagonospora nodorum]
MATDENIDTLLSFIDSQLSRDEALQPLRISDNSLEAAVNRFFETGPANINKLLKDAVPRWDETAFGGGQSDRVLTSFNIAYGPHSNVLNKALIAVSSVDRCKLIARLRQASNRWLR